MPGPTSWISKRPRVRKLQDHQVQRWRQHQYLTNTTYIPPPIPPPPPTTTNHPSYPIPPISNSNCQPTPSPTHPRLWQVSCNSHIYLYLIFWQFSHSGKCLARNIEILGHFLEEAATNSEDAASSHCQHKLPLFARKHAMASMFQCNMHSIRSPSPLLLVDMGCRLEHVSFES